MNSALRGCGWPCALLLIAVGCQATVGTPSTMELEAESRRAFADGRFENALRLAAQAAERDPALDEAPFLAGESALKLERHAEAVDWYARVPAGSSLVTKAGVARAELLLLKLSRLSEAEAALNDVLAAEPDHVEARRLLASLLGLCGRTREADVQRVALIQARDFREIELVLLGLGDTAAENADMLAAMERQNPEDPLVALALARRARQQHDLELAESHCRKALARRGRLNHRAHPAIYAELGRILLEREAHDALDDWERDLPEEAAEEPEIWMTLGDRAAGRGENRRAVDCFLECLTRSPAHQRAWQHLGQALRRERRGADADACLARAARLQELVIAAKQFHSHHTLEAARSAAKAARELGLPWEAWGWAQLESLLRTGKAAGDAIPPPPRETPRVATNADLLARIDLSEFRLAATSWPGRRSQLTGGSAANSEPRPAPEASPSADETAAAAIRFRDVAAQVGLVFLYVCGDDLDTPGSRMQEFAGGGAGVLDYDRDGWPDLYLTQGGTWPYEAPKEGPDDRPLDRLFRNEGGARLVDVTSAAALHDARYSHGMAVGDFDADGFPDLVVANFGPNRFYRNNGDGTFADVTVETGVGGDDWSTACVLADVSGDGLPDLFVVNYLKGDDLATRVCRNQNGRVRACTPHEFPAAPDRLWLNLGDGRFQDVTQDAGVSDPHGKGLGVIAGNLDGSGRISLFVAHDTTANSFWVRDENGGTRLRLRDDAVAAGLAFDRDGRSQACMGVAVDDVNGDGRPEIFVTNYYDEANTLYVAEEGGLYQDRTAEFGLREPSLKRLGFGAQFLDADLDGWPDLVLVNGHVDDERDRGIPFRMRPQLFQNLRGRRFIERRAATAGDWFDREALGRGLSRLDWNRDGREEVVVSSLDAPVALLRNETSGAVNSVTIRLVGRDGDRDAIGTTVAVHSDQWTRTRQLTAGDGYAASNERSLVFGLGALTGVERIEVVWPSGARQQFPGVAAGTEWLAVEGAPTLLSLGRETADR